MKLFAVPVIFLCAAGLAFAQAPPSGKPLPKPKSRGEQQAVKAMLEAQDPDASIKAADDLVTKYADTQFKSMALYIEADSYEQKGDHVKAMVYAEQALGADPEYLDAMVLLANVLAATTRDTDLDKDDKLARADKLANGAIELLKTAAKPDPKMPDDKWDHYKKSEEAEAWQALGNAALVRKNTTAAVADYEKGIDANADPLLMIRAGRALLAARKPEDAVTWFDKAINAPGVSDQIKNIATQDKARAAAQVSQTKK